MKLPKEVKRYCPNCKKHTTQKVKNEKNRGKNKTHPMTQFSKLRLKLRGFWKGTGSGNSGAFSRPPINARKRFNKKHSKRPDWRFTCQECKKSNTSSGKSPRSKKIVVE